MDDNEFDELLERLSDFLEQNDGFDADQLAEAADLSAQKTLDFLQEALERGLLKPQGRFWYQMPPLHNLKGFDVHIEKTYQEAAQLFVEGVAASGGKQWDGSYFTREVIERMATDLKEFSTVFFNDNDNEAVGKVVKTEVHGDKLHVRVMISQTAVKVEALIREGVLAKFSIFGKVLRSIRSSLGTGILEFRTMGLRLVTVSPDPGAYFAIAKAFNNHLNNGESNMNDEIKLEPIGTQGLAPDDVNAAQEQARQDIRASGKVDVNSYLRRVEEMHKNDETDDSVLMSLGRAAEFIGTEPQTLLAFLQESGHYGPACLRAARPDGHISCFTEPIHLFRSAIRAKLGLAVESAPNQTRKDFHPMTKDHTMRKVKNIVRCDREDLIALGRIAVKKSTRSPFWTSKG